MPATIGSLKVDLGLNSAQFIQGLSKARDDVDKFGLAAKVKMLAVSAAASGAAIALGRVVTASINHADALSKAAQKAGTTVEAISRLEYAAKLSDVSLEDLTGSLGKLGKAMVEASTNASSTASAAFRTLGVNVVDANGQLRDTNNVFSDLAERFSRMEDGALKTALAMAVFGKSGAELLPLLNSGAVGLKQMADESDRLGLTISTKTAKSAEQFNDNLTKLGNSAQGLANQALPHILPLLDGITDALTSMDPKAQSVTVGIVGLTGAAIAATPAIGAMSKAVGVLYSQLALIAALPAGVWGLAAGAYLGSTTPVGAGEDALVRQLGLTRLPGGSAFRGGWGSEAFATKKTTTTDTTTSNTNTGGGGPVDMSNFGNWVKGATDSIDPFEARMSELSDVLSEQHSPLLTLQNDLTDLATMHDAGRISTEAYGNAVVRTYANVAGAAFDMASSVTGTLSKLFKDSKAFAVADAVVQTLSGVAKAIGGSAPPFNFINAGLVAAAGAANVAQILSANENSTSVSTASTAAAAGTAAQSSAINLTVRGSGYISVDDLANQLAQSIADGGNSNLITVIKAAT